MLMLPPKMRSVAMMLMMLMLQPLKVELWIQVIFNPNLTSLFLKQILPGGGGPDRPIDKTTVLRDNFQIIEKAKL